MKKFFVCLLVLVIASCTSSDDSDGGETPSNNLAFYINANIDGGDFNSGIPTDINVATDYGLSDSYQPRYNNDGQCIDMNYEPGLYPFFNESQPHMGVGFIGFIGNANLTCSDELDNFDTLFPLGSYSYTEDAYNYGVKINYATTGDANQVYYNSYGPQDNSASFSITNVEPVDCGFSECVIITGTFSCRVYNEQNPADFLDITDGEFKLVISSFNP